MGLKDIPIEIDVLLAFVEFRIHEKLCAHQSKVTVRKIMFISGVMFSLFKRRLIFTLHRTFIRFDISIGYNREVERIHLKQVKAEKELDVLLVVYNGYFDLRIYSCSCV